MYSKIVLLFNSAFCLHVKYLVISIKSLVLSNIDKDCFQRIYIEKKILVKRVMSKIIQVFQILIFQANCQ